MCEKLLENSIRTEVMHEMLVDHLKDELCKATHNSQDKCYLEVEAAKNNIDKDFYLDSKEEHFKGRENIRKREIFY